ncbi:MAG: sugar ABC transporter permease [Eubacteriales bacterium]
MNKKIEIKTSTAYKYIMPSFIVFCIALIMPIFIALGISFTSWRGGPVIEWNGIDNYISILKDDSFWEAFLHNLQFIVTLMISQIGCAFALALIYQSKFIKLKEVHRRIVFLPAILAPLVVGAVWQLVYRTDIGFIAGILEKIGKEEWILPWLDDVNLVIPAICITLTWQYVGQYSIILTAGMQNIGPELSEAAQIDGANAFQRAMHITFPLLKPTIIVCSTMCIAGCMKMFDIIISMSGGGPGSASVVTAVYAYELAFVSQRLGYASAAAICMVILSLTMIIISRKLLSGGDD